MRMMQVGGVITVFAIIVMLFALRRRGVKTVDLRERPIV
jgi:hypothetical protein